MTEKKIIDVSIAKEVNTFYGPIISEFLEKECKELVLEIILNLSLASKVKIICKDNFNRESIDDKLIANEIDERLGNKIVDFLNGREDELSPNFFCVVPLDYKLYEFEP